MEIEITQINASYQEVDLRPTIDFADLLNNVLKNIRMCHWYATDYNIHSITGNLYSSLNDLFDELQEEIIGLSKENCKLFPIFTVSEQVGDLEESYENIERFLFYTKLIMSVLTSLSMQHFIEESSPNGLKNTIDSILSSINKSYYLLKMVNLE